MELFIHEIKLPGDSEFATRFNLVSDAFQKWQDALAAQDPNEKVLFEQYFDMKYALEQGLPISTPTS